MFDSRRVAKNVGRNSAIKHMTSASFVVAISGLRHRTAPRLRRAAPDSGQTRQT